MRRTILPIAAFTLLAAICHGGAATASSGAASAADVQAVKKFRLTDAFIKKYQAYETEAAKNPCQLSPMLVMQEEGAEDRSLSETIRAFDARPSVHSALERSGLTANDLIIGMGVLLSAAAEDLAKQHPEMVENGMISTNGKVSPENMAVYQRNKDALQRHQADLARTQLQANGGKLPDCFSQ